MSFIEYKSPMMLMLFILVSTVVCSDDAVNRYLAKLSQEFPAINTSSFDHELNHIINPSCSEHLNFTFTSRVLGNGFHRVLEFSLNSASAGSIDGFQVFQRLRPEVFVDPFELQNLKVGWQLEGPLDLETPAPGSQGTLLIIQNSTIGPLPLNLTLPFHVKYQKPIKSDSRSGKSSWLSIGPYVEFQMESPMLLLWNGGCQYGMRGNQVEMTVPVGSLAHLQLVLLISLLMILLSTSFILWNLLFTKETKKHQKRD